MSHRDIRCILSASAIAATHLRRRFDSFMLRKKRAPASRLHSAVDLLLLTNDHLRMLE